MENAEELDECSKEVILVNSIIAELTRKSDEERYWRRMMYMDYLEIQPWYKSRNLDN